MLVHQIIPLKFLFGLSIIILSGIMISTSISYPFSTTSSNQFTIGCALIIVMTSIQIGITFIGINIYNCRINF
jgi:hypothetical protein